MTPHAPAARARQQRFVQAAASAAQFTRQLAALLALAGAGTLLMLAAPPLPAVAAEATPATAQGATLAAFGGRAGLGLLATDFVQRLIDDPRTGPFFKGVKQPELIEHLADQFCQVLDGPPCVYKGKDMKKAHEEMEVRKADFNALVEVLQFSMDARGVPFPAQNQLLARLAPMHRETINTP